ncbi:MEIOTIC F-BOX protein MOF-like [Lolium perenne]|uniref:MEIOTIC F-BOX protein MOF-like n=1 Tax=Lolium perenne TaxID=4522 RepID=UPI0021F57446|nr:MEIOTIC F-BOX protein MOF-like [Lolium perenne]
MRGGDRFEVLPDDLVQHVLSFLPSRDAVETAVLARRWRYLWRSTPAVRVNGSGDGFRLFVNSLLLHRDGASPLRSFEIDADLLIGEESDDDDEYSYFDPHVDLWIRHALSTCRARSLTVRIPLPADQDRWSPKPFASPHLTTMRLQGVDLDHGSLDFSCCTKLLHLSLTACSLDGDAIVSPSLERLHIMDCASESPIRISTPSLRHLQLSGHHDGICTAPSSLDTMPCLTNASIQLTGFVEGGDGDANAGRSLILRGLSEATSLELIATRSDGRTIFLRDLAWCPTFPKLKTLILNEWCVYDDVSAIECLLRHTPRLESLILQLNFKNCPTLQVEGEGNDNTSEQSILNFEHLKTVEIRNRPPYYYEPVVYFDTRIGEVFKLFSDLGIPSSKISINYNTEGQPSTYTQFLSAVIYVKIPYKNKHIGQIGPCTWLP